MLFRITSTFGGTTNSKFGFRWQVIDDLTFRGTYAQGFRAPSIGELFGTFSRFDATLTDPCNNATGQRAINCAILGVPNPATFQQSNSQISVLTGGNKDLQPEKSKNTTLGAVYSPGWAEGTSWSQKTDFEFTYYNIRVNNAIQAKDAQTLLDRCADTLDPAFCSVQSRNGAGYVAFLDDTLENLGRVKTSGFDFTLNWVGPDTAWGRPGASWQNTYVNKYKAVDTSTGDAEPPGPRHRSHRQRHTASAFDIASGLADRVMGLRLRVPLSVRPHRRLRQRRRIPDLPESAQRQIPGRFAQNSVEPRTAMCARRGKLRWQRR